MGILIPRMQRYYQSRFKALGSLSGIVEEAYGSSTIIKAFNQEDKMLAKFNRENEELYSYSLKASIAGGMFGPIMRFTSYLGTAGILIVGVILATSDPIH
jgi:ATP-binding cassette subfamily B protein